MDVAPLGSKTGTDVPYTDCRTGLIVFGVLQLGIAVLLLLLGALTLGFAHKARFLGGGLVFLAGAGVFGSLGVGSIFCRRWARALSLLCGWAGLLFGIVMIVSIMAFACMGSGAVPQEHLMMALLGAGIPGCVMVLVPGAMVVFYGHPNVKATCEARDPQERWTDRCPLPLLAVTLWLGYTCLSVLALAPSINFVVALGSHIWSGWQGALIDLGLVALWAYCAWAFYRRKVAGWWLYLAISVAWLLISALTSGQLDYAEMGRQMRLQHELPPSPMMAEYRRWMWAVYLPKIAYLLWVKRYFSAAPEV